MIFDRVLDASHMAGSIAIAPKNIPSTEAKRIASFNVTIGSEKASEMPTNRKSATK